ncbi:unnamed protein product [Dovyalis caffra]|uniref:Uncharacterized protein n=1 Tax=Dovyalis caffra TaxID=77055 RepID=A0AAV1QVJ7_9ROSI|nr:unnamed protein product [Dovyalis caffra]
MFEQYHDATRLIVNNRDVLFMVGFSGSDGRDSRGGVGARWLNQVGEREISGIWKDWEGMWFSFADEAEEDEEVVVEVNALGAGVGRFVLASV